MHGQTKGQHNPPNVQRQPDQMVEYHLDEKCRQENDHQCQAGRHDIGELDAGPRPLELMIDELLVVQQFAVRFRLGSQSHDACSSRGAERCVRNCSFIIRTSTPKRTKDLRQVDFLIVPFRQKSLVLCARHR